MTHRWQELKAHGGGLLLRFGVLAFVGAFTADLIDRGWQRLDQVYLELLPRDQFFHYDRIEAIEPMISGKPMRFNSFADLYVAGDYYWNDVIFCDHNDGLGFGHYDSKNSNRENAEVRIGAENVPWTFGGKYAPEVGAVCYLRASITGVYRRGVKKHQVLSSAKFVIVSDKEDAASRH